MQESEIRSNPIIDRPMDIADPFSPALYQLMEIAGTLRDISLSSRHHEQIPKFLVGALGLKSVLFALVDRGAGQEAKIIEIESHCSSDAGPHPQRTDWQQCMPTLIDSLQRQFAESNGLGTYSPFSACARSACACRHLVFYRKVNESHSLLLLLHEQTGQPPLDSNIKVILNLISTYLAKLLRGTVECTRAPEKLGKPFERLSPREWRVLLALETGEGEKQIAYQLGLSPHTLHSHIKTIYRKFGVGARLAVIQKVEEARYEYRIRSMLQR